MKKLLFILMAGLLSFTSCSDFLDADNKSNVTSDKYFNTKDGFETLVNYAYAQMKTLYNGAPTMFSCGTDLYIRGRSAMPDQGLHAYALLNAENATVASFYTNCYKGIQAANCVLYYAKTVTADASLISLRSSEASFIRALYYFELVQQFGGVSLVKEYVNKIVTEVPRATTEETFQFIIDELEALAATSSPLPNTDKTGRVTKQAVYHYLSKVYLTAGWDLNKNEYYGKAAEYAEKAIALGSGLDETFQSLWWPANDNKHQEVLFAVQYDRASSVAAGIAETDNGNSMHQNYSQYLGGADQGFKQGSSCFIPSERMIYLFQKGDSRYEATFMTKLYCKDQTKPKTTGDYYAPYNGTTANDYIAFYYPPHYAASAEDIAAWRAVDPTHRSKTVVIPQTSNTNHADLTPCTYYQAATEGDNVFGSPACSKYDDPSATFLGSTGYRDIVLARLGETYLIAAEAYLKAGNQPKADAMLNVVRERAFRGSGIAYAKSNVTIDDILTERALEFACEGFRWNDLRRTKKLVEYNVNYNVELLDASSFVGDDGNQKLYRPIPQSAIDLNNAEITQNPGYSQN